MRFYLSINCTNCGEEVLDGPVLTMIEHDGLPVVPLDMAAHSSLRCDACGALSHIGDFEVYSEDEV